MKPETEKFIAKAQESLKAFQMLCDGGIYNFAVSRAYYMMFYIAEAHFCGSKTSVLRAMLL